MTFWEYVAVFFPLAMKNYIYLGNILVTLIVIAHCDSALNDGLISETV